MKTAPWNHQAKEYKDHRRAKARAQLWGMRTGKTKVAIDTACDMYDVGSIEGVLVFAPNGVHANWPRKQLPIHAWDNLPYKAMAWSSSSSEKTEFKEGMREMLDHRGMKWLTVNSEALIVPRAQKATREFIKACKGRFLYVVDEVHEFRRPGARKTLLARGMARKAPYCRILTGTSVLNSPLHAFSQFEMLAKGALGFTRFDDFKEEFAEYEQGTTYGGQKYPRLVGYKNVEKLRALMAEWSSVVLREDCEDMPALLETERPVPLSPAQRKAYDLMVHEALMDIVGGEDYNPVSGGVKVNKLQQILGGFLHDPHGDVVSIDSAPPRLDAMWEEVEGSLPGKTVVWCQYTEDIRRVVARLSAELGPGAVVEYHGKVPQRVRDKALDRLQTDPTCLALIGQPQSGGMGLDMSAADTILWYSYPSKNAIVYEQAKERATAVGGKAVSIVHLVTPNTVDEDMLEGLRERLSLADIIAGRGLRDLLMKGNTEWLA